MMSYTKEQTKYVNCGLHVNFWSFLYMSFCFMMKKDHFKQKLLLWPQVPFKKSFPMMCYHGNITALRDFFNFREIAKKQDVS